MMDNPCLQNWKKILPYHEGRFCENCHKLAIDFTGLSGSEIISNVIKSNNNICGRFYKNQGEQKIRISAPRQNGHYFPKGLATIILLHLIFNIAKGEVFIPSNFDSVYAAIKANEIGENSNGIDKTNQGYRIYGKVQDSSIKQNLVGVSVAIKNNMYTAITDNNGYFHLELPAKYAKKNFKILFSFVGYNMLTVKVQNKKKEFKGSLNVFLHPAITNLDKVIVICGAMLSE